MDVAVYLQPIFHLHIEPLLVPPRRYHNLVVILVVSNRNQNLEHIICNWIIITSDHITTFKNFCSHTPCCVLASIRFINKLYWNFAFINNIVHYLHRVIGRTII